MQIVSRMEEMHLNLAALHNVKSTYIEVLLCVMFVKTEPDIQRLQKGQGVIVEARTCACIHVHAYLSSHVCTNVCVCVQVLVHTHTYRMCGWSV